MNDGDLENLLEQCRSNEPMRQVEAIQRLMGLNAFESVPALVATLTSSDAVVRCTAAEALGRLGSNSWGTAGAALLALLADPEVIVRAEAADALGILRYTPAVEGLRSLLLTDEEPLVRASAAESLGDLGDASVLSALELALHDADDSVRGYAANAMGRLGDQRLSPTLHEYAISETAPKVIAELQGARYRLGARESLDALLALLKDADEDLATNILNVLDDVTGREARPTAAVEAARIRSAVTALSERFPILTGTVEHLVVRLAKTGQ
jgi:HEAT repeat protein